MIDPKQDLIDLISTVIPNSNRVIIHVEEKEKVSASGIARPEANRGDSETLVGTVLAVGEGYWTEYGHFLKTTSKIGDRVLIDKMSGINIRVDREGKMLPFSEEITEDRLAVRICRQESILFTFPKNWYAKDVS